MVCRPCSYSPTSHSQSQHHKQFHDPLDVLQGHFQIVLDTDRCPLFLDGLSVFQKVMYCSGVWAYVVGALSTPFFVVVPLVTIWAGIFPIIVSWWAACEFLCPPSCPTAAGHLWC